MSDYAKGFKEGFLAGYEAGKNLSQKNYNYEPWPSTSPYIELKDTCPKCGIKISGAIGYVCGSINCPVQYKATSSLSYTVGAVGSMSDNAGQLLDSAGANGPSGPGSIFHHPV